MAIVHVAFKSSSKAPPAAGHAQYIARDGQYQRRGGVELVEHGNMPEFAQDDPHSFWVAADAYERANGRTYTELQLALPRELSSEDRNELAREATRELLGDRFAYTLAVHNPLAKDNIDQPHLHLMFSERAVTDETRGIEEERFFKRNGAKKDPAWNDRNKPDEVREKWVAMMNAAMERAGQEQRLDARSWAEQGREDLAALREPKTLGGDGPDAIERREEIAELRRRREELPAPQLDQAAAVEQIEREAERTVRAIEKRRDEELSILDKLIEKARELAVEVKERAVTAAKNVAERVESFFGGGKEEISAERESAQEQKQSRPPTPPSIEEQLDRRVGELDRKLTAQESIEARLAHLDQRMDVTEAKEKQEKERKQQQEIEPTRGKSRGFGMER
jgi:hypothetical protein